MHNMHSYTPSRLPVPLSLCETARWRVDDPSARSFNQRSKFDLGEV